MGHNRVIDGVADDSGNVTRLCSCLVDRYHLGIDT